MEGARALMNKKGRERRSGVVCRFLSPEGRRGKVIYVESGGMGESERKGEEKDHRRQEQSPCFECNRRGKGTTMMTNWKRGVRVGMRRVRG